MIKLTLLIFCMVLMQQANSQVAMTTMSPPATTMGPPPGNFMDHPCRFRHHFRMMPRMRCHCHPNKPEWIDARFAGALMKAIAINNRYMLALQGSHSPKLADAISNNKVLENMLNNAESNLITNQNTTPTPSMPVNTTPAPEA